MLNTSDEERSFRQAREALVTEEYLKGNFPTDPTEFANVGAGDFKEILWIKTPVAAALANKALKAECKKIDVLDVDLIKRLQNLAGLDHSAADREMQWPQGEVAWKFLLSK